MPHEHQATQANQTATRSIADNQHSSGLSKPAVQPFQKMPSSAPAGNNNSHPGSANTQPFQLKPNDTGLPDDLKSGIESLSGYSMDDVRVNYNSARPAQLQAHAYAQGTDIHIAPGQERHLAHEAWHVVQQKQGRVSPTVQLQKDIPVNDDAGLEQEADIMGAKALQRATIGPIPLQYKRIEKPVLQGAFLDIAANNFKDYITEQETKQAEIGAHRESFTTVGFEHEFTQTEGEGNVLAGISHLELAKARPLAFTKLPFILETDAANALELVSPPFLIKTLSNSMIPDPADVEKVDSIIRANLDTLSKKGTIDGMIKGFQTTGLDFSAAENLKIQQKNVSHKSGVKDYASMPELDFTELKKIKIKPSEKGGGITSQVNFATTAQTFDDLQNINKEDVLDTSGARTPGFNPKAILATLEAGIKAAIAQTGIADTPGLKIFINQLARTLSGQFAVPAIEHVMNEQKKIYDGTSDLASTPAATSKFRFNAYLSSAVKDVDGAWIKDSLMNIGLGVLDNEDWTAIKSMVANSRLADGIRGLALPEFTNINGFEKETDKEAGNVLIQETLRLAKEKMLAALPIISGQIDMVYSHDLMTKEGKKTTELGIFPTEAVAFMGHNDQMIGARQDTYIDTRKTQLPQVTGERLHVAETRRDGIDSLYKLAFNTDKLDDKGLDAMWDFQAAKVAEINTQILELQLAKADAEKDIKDIRDKIEELEPMAKTLYEGYDAALEEFKKTYQGKPKQLVAQFEKAFDPGGIKDKLAKQQKALPGKVRQQTPIIEKKKKEITAKQEEQAPYKLLMKEIEARKKQRKIMQEVRQQILKQQMEQQQLF
ncbi:eCIS core domain-containing protein [Chitinophaga filiformis]|uniref:eCIS core domain-containing protein n=1 Tax=Chitinophaga filiformis TaxID=104663 RepID=A0A1G7LJ49_CHIFI|nr:DUF4157 domain-containing protein [Chitinophaga filiformis]SDF49384.1 protein of unknown function [Chitinophaga filiformis]